MRAKILTKRLRLTTLLLFFIQLGLQNVTFSQNQNFIDANKDFEAKEYDKAIEVYSELINSSIISPELYYNLGNAYYKKDDYGHAMLYYEKALKIKPNDTDIKHNIYITKRKIDSEIVELPDFFLKRWWSGFINIFGLTLWTILSILFAILFVTSLGLLWFKKEQFKIISTLFSLLIGLIFITVLSATSQVKKSIYNNQHVILIKPDTIFVAPDRRSEILYQLEPGEKLFLEDSLNSWYKVNLLNKETGWIRKTLCEKI